MNWRGSWVDVPQHLVLSLCWEAMGRGSYIAYAASFWRLADGDVELRAAGYANEKIV